LTAIRAKLHPEPARESLPPPKVYAARMLDVRRVVHQRPECQPTRLTRTFAPSQFPPTPGLMTVVGAPWGWELLEEQRGIYMERVTRE
jgi:hypothetical protein